MAVDNGIAPPAIGASVTDVPGEGVADRVLGYAGLLAFAGVLIQSAAHVFNAQVLDARVWSLSADVDGNVFAWASSAATFAAALAAALLIAVFPKRKRELAAVGIILAFFSMDDVVAIHEKLATYVRGDLLGHGSGAGRPIWPIIFLPLMATVAIVLWRLAGEERHAGGNAIRRGLVLLVLAIFIEASSVLYFEPSGDIVTWPDTIEVALEEGCELAGWILIAGGLLALLIRALVDAPRAERDPA